MYFPALMVKFALPKVCASFGNTSVAPAFINDIIVHSHPGNSIKFSVTITTYTMFVTFHVPCLYHREMKWHLLQLTRCPHLLMLSPSQIILK